MNDSPALPIIEDLRMIHPPWEWWKSAPAWAGIVCAAVALWFAARWLRRRLAEARRRAARRIPGEHAIRLLQELPGLWRDEAPDEFALRLSGILRGYLEETGAGPCSKLTASELSARLPGIDFLEMPEREWLRETAWRCEPTKWAGRPMDRGEANDLVRLAIALVRAITQRLADAAGPASNPAGAFRPGGTARQAGAP